MNAERPTVEDLVLVGGGHSHALLARMLAMRPMAGVRVTMISDAAHAAYSGMLPGLIAGAYTYDEAHIDLRRLCAAAGIRFLRAAVEGVDHKQKLVYMAGRPPLAYDALSLNAGSVPGRGGAPGAEAFAVPCKPVPLLLAAWERVLAEHTADPRRTLRLSIVGAGAGGVELSLCMRARLGRAAQITVVERGPQILAAQAPRARAVLAALLRERGIAVRLNATVVRVDADALVLAPAAAGGESSPSAERLPHDHVFWITTPGPPPWLAATGLPLADDGFLAVDDTLQIRGCPGVFAAGDIATILSARRPKAGVFAVRQAATLAANLRRYWRGEALKPFKPQAKYLSLIGTADGAAVAVRGAFAARSPLFWAWKDRIDRRFMRQFTELPAMGEGSPWPTSLTLDAAALTRRAALRCHGCGGKVGGSILARALARAEAFISAAPVAESSAGTAPAAESSAGTAPAAESSAGTAPAAESSAGAAPAAESSAGTAPAAESSAGAAPAAESSAGAAPAAESSAGAAPAAESSAGAAPAAESSAGAAPAAESSAGAAPAAESSAGTAPAAAVARTTPAAEDIVIGLAHPDDAAVLALPPGRLLVQSADTITALVSDPYTFGRIAVTHAFSDIYAMGGKPHSLLALLNVPLVAERALEEDLYQLLAGILAAARAHGAVLLGGHTREAHDLSVGLSVNGLAARADLKTKSGLAAGDALLLTKALGTGTLFAAAMRAGAKGRDLDAAIASMLVPNARAAAILGEHQATAMTDVSGFGLAGHLHELLNASAVRAALSLDALPLLPGAAAAIRNFPSTGQAANAQLTTVSASADPRLPLLFDPQTSGGLLAGVPAARAAACLAALRAAGLPAARIGIVLPPSQTQGDPWIELS